MANGLLNIFGTQYGIPPGNWKDQLSVPYSAVIQVNNVVATATNATIAVPAGCQGVIIIPAGGTSVEFAMTTTPTTYISPTYPTIISFDPNHIPADLYFTTVACTVDVRFF